MRFLFNVFLSSCAVLVLIGCATNDAYSVSRAYERGRAAANRDLAKGVLAIEGWGLLITPVSRETDRFLLETYGIQTRIVGRCEANSRIRAHAVGYNEVAQAEIERRFGKDIWENATKEAGNLIKRTTNE